MSLESRKRAALEDPGAELLDRLTGLWERYGRIALVVIGAAAVVGVVAYLTVSANRRNEEAASSKLGQADDLFWRGDYERSQQIATDVARQYGGTPSGTDALRIAGDDAFWRGHWKDAVVQYRAYLGKRGSGLVANAVRRSLAYALESDGQYAEAAKLYDQLVGAFERESSGEMLFAAARCERQIGQADAAKRDLQRIVDEFGDTSYQVRAREALAEIQATGR